MSLFISILALLLSTFSFTAAEGKFQAYWNVPLDACTEHGVYFDLDKFSIVHNTGNTFYGDKVDIFYSAGSFPQYDKYNHSINGGIPQRGNLTTHIEKFVARLLQILPQHFSGPAVLDFETYLPSFNVSLPEVYKQQSEDWVRTQHPDWKEDAIEAEARRTFDEDVTPYFESLLKVGLYYRPDALIGYYHYPYCHNYNYPYTHCQQEVMDLNDELKPWLLSTSTALFPSVYTFLKGFDPSTRANSLGAKLKETQRVNDGNRPILPYFWYRYHDSPQYLSSDVARAVLWLVRSHNSSGVVLWGSTQELADEASCLDFRSYLYGTLGPLLKCFQDMPDSMVNALKLRYPTETGEEPERPKRRGVPSNLFEREAIVQENAAGARNYYEIVEQTDVEREMEELERKYVQEHNRNLLMSMIHYYCKSLNLE